MNTSVKRAALSCALLATTALATPSVALAQTIGTAAPAVRETVDGNGVNLISGKLSMPLASISLGSADSGADYNLVLQDGQTYGNVFGWVTTENSVATVVVGASAEKFSWNGSAYVPLEGRGSTFDGTNYKTADGTIYVFNGPSGFDSSAPSLGEIQRPDGEKLTYYFLQGTLVTGSTQWGPITKNGHRVSSIVSSSGFQFQVEYQANSLSSEADIERWQSVRKVKLLNTTVEVCSYVMAEECATTNIWPSIENNYDSATNTGTYTDTIGRVARFAYDSSSRIIAMRYFGSSSDNITIAYDGNGRVASVTKDGITTGYTYADESGVRTTTVSLPGGASRVMRFNLTKLTMLSHRDELHRLTQYQYDDSARVTQVTAPDGNYVVYGYDGRGNVTSTTAYPKGGSTLAAITTSATYSTSCSSQITCNKPTSTTDARGHVTNYSWDPTHGSLTSVTMPAAPSGVRPEVRYSYTALQAVYKEPAGTVSGNPTYKLTSVSTCQTQSSCAGGGDEVKSTIAYDLVGGYRNLFPTSVSTGAGNGSLTATIASGYDRFGNVQTVDGPLAGTADTARSRYDALRRTIATVSPDPDGGGALKHRASRTTYNALGQVAAVESGTANGQSDGDIDAMTVLERGEVDYDSGGRPVTQRLIAGGSIQAVTQTSYDGRGRVECTAQRMNPGAFGSLPGACSLGAEGSFGPDRITRTVYDAAGQVTQVRTAVGTALEAAEVATAYTLNGKAQTVTDAENNRTTYEYDGHDRLLRTRFPVPTKGALASSSTDYEELGYDAGSNVISRRVRDGQMIGYGYDNLGRVVSKNLPNAVYFENDVSYGHDLLGRITAVHDSAGHQQSFSYDALGRKLSEGSNWYDTVSSAYDVAGRRTRLTWRDGFYVTYEHLVTGEMSAIRENGSFMLASFGYDDRGRRTRLGRGDGTVTSYSFDPASRLSQLINDLAGTVHDQTLGFSYNPAGQITKTTRSNDVFAWTVHYNVDRPYASNGLNQYTQTGSIVPTYDGRGNLTSAGNGSYTYTVENRLATGGGSNFAYDATGRLIHISSSATDLLYDGTDHIQEVGANGGPTRRRYVHGPGVDEPIVWYEGLQRSLQYRAGSERQCIPESPCPKHRSYQSVDFLFFRSR